jgi:hypothetical protein
MASSNQQLLVSYHAQQQTVGWIAFLMPFSVRILASVFDGIAWTDSISAYYYTALRDVFVGSLAIGGLALAFFRTDRRHDAWVAVVAGLAAIGIGLFPMKILRGDILWRSATTPEAADKLLDALQHAPHGPLGLHFYCVATFFAATAYLVIFSFRANTAPDPTPQKLARNKVYVVCGAIMAASGIWLAYQKLHQRAIFWPELCAVVSFAAAWLVKGQAVPGLKDEAGAG